MIKSVKTTGQMRQMLVNAAKGVLNGDLEIASAEVVHKLAKNITESLYSETKISMFRREIGQTIQQMGELRLGDPNDKDDEGGDTLS